MKRSSSWVHGDFTWREHVVEIRAKPDGWYARIRFESRNTTIECGPCNLRETVQFNLLECLDEITGDLPACDSSEGK